jgi:hypothetical protein
MKMHIIVVDVNNIIVPNDLDSLKKLINPIPNTSLKLALYMKIPKNAITILKGLPKGKPRVVYLNTKEFVTSITGFAYVSYDPKKAVCEILKISGISIKEICRQTIGVFPNNAMIWAGIPVEDNNIRKRARELTKAGFDEPHISEKRPSGTHFSSYGLCMLKLNDNQLRISASEGNVNYVLNEFEKKMGICQMQVVLTSDTLRYLRDLQKIGMTINYDGSISQKEIAGNLICERVDKDLVHHLTVDYDSLLTGNEMGVSIVTGMYNFHSHPREAYDRANMKVGWPSSQDYLGFFMAFLEDGTIIHLVTSLEGIYVLSMSEYSLENKTKFSKKIKTFILDNYNFCEVKNKTPVQYTRDINSILYKGNHLFVLQYLPWHMASQRIDVMYKSNQSNCFTNDKTFDNYQKLYL